LKLYEAGEDNLSGWGIKNRIIAELRQREGPSSRAPYSKRKKRKPISWFSRGYHCIALGHVCMMTTTTTKSHNMVAPNNQLAETCNLGLPCNSLILDIHVMINWHLSKQGIRWPASHDHIAGSSLGLIEVTFFFEVDRWPSTGFWLDCGLMTG